MIKYVNKNIQIRQNSSCLLLGFIIMGKWAQNMIEKNSTMNGLTTFERRQNILRLLAEQPGLRVAEMAEIFQVAEGTIRNDLNALEAEEKLRAGVYGRAA